LAEDIWEKSKYKVKAKLVDDSKPYTGKLDLYVLKNGDESAPLKEEKDISVQAGKALERTFDVPEVGPKEVNYKLSIIAKYGDSKEKSQELAEATVWPKEVEVHVKNEEDDKDFKDVKLVVLQNAKAVSKPVTNASGKCKVELTHKRAYSIDVRSPYEIVKDDTDPEKIRAHELVAIRRIVPTFVKPDVTKAKPWVANDAKNTEANRTDAVKLFVNLESKDGDAADARGNVIEFEVCAKPRSEGKKDDRIYIEVAFSKESERNDPVPELLNDPAVVDLSNADDPKVYKGYVKLDKDGGSAKFKVNTGLAGGDSCKVSIGGRKDKRDDEARTFINWRKLFYELRYPNLLKSKLKKGDYSEGLKAAITGKLAKAFIVFEKYRSHAFFDFQATFKKKNGMILPKSFFKAGAGEIYVVTNGWLNTTDKFSEDAKLRAKTVYVSLCDRAFSSNITAYTWSPVIESDDFDLEMADGTYVFAKRTDNGEDNLKVEAGYKWQAVVTGAHDKATEWKVESDTPSKSGASAGKVSITDTRRPGKSVTVTFAAKDGGGFESALSASEQAKVESFVDGLLASDPELRDAGNQVNLRFTGLDKPDDLSRLNAVRSAAKSKFDAVGKTVNVHPGLDRNGAPREGNMDVAWLSVKDYETINVKLPKSPKGTPEHERVLPGDFVGAAETDTECNVTIKFGYAAGGEINGNSGGGSQIMVLRAAASAGALSETVCHELGHSMGMTIVPGLNNDILPPGLTTKHIDNGGSSYVNDDGTGPYTFTDGKRNVHKGGHCAFSIPGDKVADPKFGGWSPAAGCIMWGSGGSAETRTSYCPECLKLIKARRLEDIMSEFEGRGADQG